MREQRVRGTGVGFHAGDRARPREHHRSRASAARYGSAELTLARDKLRAAEDAADDGDREIAERLAVEADLDADLAAATARNQQTRALADEVRSGLQTLDDELRRQGAAQGGIESR
jgi:hypothetical protein